MATALLATLYGALVANCSAFDRRQAARQAARRGTNRTLIHRRHPDERDSKARPLAGEMLARLSAGESTANEEGDAGPGLTAGRAADPERSQMARKSAAMLTAAGTDGS